MDSCSTYRQVPLVPSLEGARAHQEEQGPFGCGTYSPVGPGTQNEYKHKLGNALVS